MVRASDLESYLYQLLQPELFEDYCPNGLQISGKENITSLVSGVTASQALIDAAHSRGADAILVHHGYFWRGEDPRLIGMKYQRVEALIKNNISLWAYHLPLDAHPELGNNAQLSTLLDIETEGHFANNNIGFYGRLKTPMSAQAFAEHISLRLQRAPIHIETHSRLIERVAWCSGGAQSYIEEAAKLEVDAYISGEISEQTTHIARELGVDFYAAGHHATERYGVKALGEHLATKFDLSHEFVEIDNPA